MSHKEKLLEYKMIMRHLYLTILVTSITFALTAQNNMRSIHELLNNDDPGWVYIDSWIKNAKNKVEVLPADLENSKNALYQTQVTTSSPMGAVIYMTGGILIDNGWIRILGSGNEKLNRTLPEWNKGKTFDEFGDTSPFLLVADDVIGGFYMINGGGLGKDLGNIYYFSPDNLTYEPLDISYTEFLLFCFNGDLNEFYENYRWSNWQDEVSNLDGNSAYSFDPYLWTDEGKDIKNSIRKIVSAENLYLTNLQMKTKFGF